MRQKYLILIMGGLLSGCGSGFEVATSGTIGLGSVAQVGTCEATSSLAIAQASTNAKVAIERRDSPFAFRKVQLNIESPMAQLLSLYKAKSPIKAIDVVLNGACLLAHPEHQEFMGEDLQKQNVYGLRTVFSASVVFEEWPALETLEDKAQGNPCIIGVASSGTVQKSQVQVAATADPDFAEQEHLASMSFDSAHNYFFVGQQVEQDTVVAIVDTGIDYNHPDLACNMWPGRGIDIVNDDNDPYDDDSEGHGTHVSGLVGACGNNNVGGTGVMPSNVQLMGVKVLNAQGGGSLNDVVNGISWAVENGAEVINLSLEANQTSSQLVTAVTSAIQNGVVVIGAAGNSGIEIDDLLESSIVFPAVEAELAGLMAVGSVDTSSTSRSTFSNFGTQFVEISAPGAVDAGDTVGGGIYSTLPSGGYGRIMGTSQSAPLVAGAAALLIGYFKSKSVPYRPDDIEFYLREKSTRRLRSLAGSFAQGAVLDFAKMTTSVSRDSTKNDDSVFFKCP